MDLEGKNYRLVKDNLEKDIDPAKSRIIVKANKVVVKLQKVSQGGEGTNRCLFAGGSFMYVYLYLTVYVVVGSSYYALSPCHLCAVCAQVKGEYSYEHWPRLTAKKAKEANRPDTKKDPSGAIMDMMKDM